MIETMVRAGEHGGGVASRFVTSPMRSLYATVVVGDPSALPEHVHQFHFAPTSTAGVGVFEVVRPRAWLARVVGRLLRFPAAGSPVPVEVEIERAEAEEIWTRRLGGRRLVSHQFARDNQLIERVGCVELVLAVQIEDKALRFSSLGACIVVGRSRIRVPRLLAAQVHGEVLSSGGERCLHVAVRISSPMLGSLLTYRGELVETARQ